MDGSPVGKMDVYSEMLVPFDVAAFCRGRKLCAEAVALRIRLTQWQEAKAWLTAAERQADRAEQEVKSAIAAARQKMEQEP